jgi:hypothetical protein
VAGSSERVDELLVPYNSENFVTSRGTVRFTVRISASWS